MPKSFDEIYTQAYLRDSTSSYAQKLSYRFSANKDYVFWYLNRISEATRRVKDCLGSNLKKMTILDIGCGSGWLAVNLALDGASSVGIDVARELVYFSKRRAKYHDVPVDFIVADCTWLPFREEKFDFAVAFDVLEHMKRPVSCLEEVYRILKRDSKFFFETPNKLSLFSPHSHSSLISQLKRWWYKKVGKKINYAESCFSDFENLFTLSQLTTHLTRIGFQETHLLMPQKTGSITREALVTLFEKVDILKSFKPSLNIIALKTATNSNRNYNPRSSR